MARNLKRPEPSLFGFVINEVLFKRTNCVLESAAVELCDLRLVYISSYEMVSSLRTCSRFPLAIVHFDCHVAWHRPYARKYLLIVSLNWSGPKRCRSLLLLLLITSNLSFAFGLIWGFLCVIFSAFLKSVWFRFSMFSLACFHCWRCMLSSNSRVYVIHRMYPGRSFLYPILVSASNVIAIYRNQVFFRNYYSLLAVIIKRRS